jgi:thiol:disulfide interchange protein DsbC
MLNASAPAAANCGDTPIEKNLELGRKYRITGTPTILFASGERVPGAISAEQVEKVFAQNGKK